MEAATCSISVTTLFIVKLKALLSSPAIWRKPLSSSFCVTLQGVTRYTGLCHPRPNFWFSVQSRNRKHSIPSGLRLVQGVTFLDTRWKVTLRVRNAGQRLAKIVRPFKFQERGRKERGHLYTLSHHSHHQNTGKRLYSFYSFFDWTQYSTRVQRCLRKEFVTDRMSNYETTAVSDTATTTGAPAMHTKETESYSSTRSVTAPCSKCNGMDTDPTDSSSSVPTNNHQDSMDHHISRTEPSHDDKVCSSSDDDDDDRWWEVSDKDRPVEGIVTAATSQPPKRRSRRWWHSLPKGAEAIVKELAAERVLVDLLDNRLAASPIHGEQQPQQQQLPVLPHVGTPHCGVNFAAVTQLVDQYPGLCHKRYEFQWDHGTTRHLTLLAILACFPATPLPLVQTVYQAYPTAIRQRESRKGCLPLHYACTFGASIPVVQFLYRHHPPALSLPRFDGLYPLHLALYFQRQCLPLLQQVLVPSWPQGLTTPCAFEQWNVMHIVARGQAPMNVVHYLHAALMEQQQEHQEREATINSDTISTNGTRRNHDDDNNSHNNNRNHDNDDTIRPTSLVYEYCSAADDKGRTPLHLACRQTGNLPLVQYLIQMAPSTLVVRDSKFCTPIFYAARHQTAAVLDWLWHQHEQQQQQQQQQQETFHPGRLRPRRMEEDVFWMDQWGATLLHYAAMENDSHTRLQLDTEEQQHSQSEEEQAARDTTTRALDESVSTSNNESMVEYLTRLHPQWVFYRTHGDGCRYTPLHLACRYKGPFDNIRTLVIRHPQSLWTECQHGLLPLRLAEMYYFRSGPCRGPTSTSRSPMVDERQHVLEFLRKQMELHPRPVDNI